MIDISKGLKTTLFLIYIGLLFSCSNQEQENHNPTVEVRYQDGKAMLYRHGEPYSIKGAAGTEHLDKVALYGGNSIRTWSLHDADRLLDEAHELGLTVTLGLEIGRQAWGYNFNYWKFWEVNKKIEELRPIIEKYKDHPALLMWGVGNELQFFGGGKRFLIFHTIDKVAKMIKEVDPNHPTMTAVDVFSKKNKIGSYRYIMPNIDILGFNAFKTLGNMYDRVYEKKGWGKAYILSEWGPNGHWEVTDTEWGAPKELKNSEKREMMEKYWNNINKDTTLFLGSYAFYWGFKHEATHTWFSLFSKDGSETASVNFLKYAWSGERAENLAPNVNDLSIETNQGLVNDNVYLESNQIYNAIADTDDSEGDSLRYKWEIRPEENYFVEIYSNDFEIKNYNMEHLIQKVDENTIQFIAPKDEGPYRIFVFAFDGNGNVASYNIPFYVIQK
ncbi:glycoside hydrolase family 2 TIM barrel-domain containing protein [Aquiflexum sp.]|uniref:glycoside hydrolase family 2 TIM barrel-domain containing protein n=1 Tax=Aquiflexum sp. TaxID=1872584 RepID=UPI0035947B0A